MGLTCHFGLVRLWIFSLTYLVFIIIQPVSESAQQTHFEVTGEIYYRTFSQLDGRIRLTNISKYHFKRDRDAWWMNVELQPDSPSSPGTVPVQPKWKYQIGCDGTNVFCLIVHNRTSPPSRPTQAADPFPQAPYYSALGYVYPGRMPLALPLFRDSHAIWLGMASDSWWRLSGNPAAVPEPWSFSLHTWRTPEVFHPVRWSLQPGNGFTLEAKWRHPGKYLKDIMSLDPKLATLNPPLDQGYEAGHFQVHRTRNDDPELEPTAYTLEVFVPSIQATGPEDLVKRMEWSMTNLTSRTDFQTSDFRPKIPQPTFVEDYRFLDQLGAIQSVNYIVSNSWDDVAFSLLQKRAEGLKPIVEQSEKKRELEKARKPGMVRIWLFASISLLILLIWSHIKSHQK